MNRVAIRVVLAACFSMADWAQAQTYKQIYNFHNDIDGFDITSTLVRDSTGNLYGTAYGGGASYGTACFNSRGCGTVFKITKAKRKITLHSFGLTAIDGRNPYAGVIFGNGTLYGTTIYGGHYGATVQEICMAPRRLVDR